MHLRFAAAFLCAAVLASSAHADDSSAALGMGGLELVRAPDIRMAREDLYISPKVVRIRYVFINDGAKDVDSLVAFPLPDIDTWEFYEEPIGTVGNDPVNFVGFTAKSDGKPVPVRVEQRAFLNGRDVTDTVTAAGLPVNILLAGNVAKLDHLAAAKKALLEKAGLVQNEGAGQEHPRWTVHTKFYWTQHFPAGKTVIVEHGYTPVTGQTFFTEYDLKPKQDPDGGRRWQRDYCMDAATLSAITQRIRSGSKPGQSGMLNIYTTDFILKTANNWKGGIGSLNLTIDKLKPSNILSLCWDGELKRTGPTTFQSTLRDLHPSRDIKFVVLENPAAEADQ
ncbi:MAG: DUF4424 family protein [Rhizomicrobium sp.]